MADETLLEPLDTSPDTSTMPETDQLEPVVEDVQEGEDTGEGQADTRDFEAELATAREEARKAALAEVEEQNAVKELRTRVAQSHQWLSRTGADEISNIVRYFVEEVESGKKTAAQALAELKPENIERGPGARMASAVITSQLAAWDDLQDAFLKADYPDWRIPPELTKRKEMALAKLDTVEMFNVRKDILRRAVMENDAPAEAKRLSEEQSKQTQKAAANAALKGQDSQRAAAPAPTSARGGGTRPRLTLDQIEKMPMAQWMNYPKEQRDQMLNDAHEAAATRRR